MSSNKRRAKQKRREKRAAARAHSAAQAERRAPVEPPQLQIELVELDEKLQLTGSFVDVETVLREAVGSPAEVIVAAPAPRPVPAPAPPQTTTAVQAPAPAPTPQPAPPLPEFLSTPTRTTESRESSRKALADMDAALAGDLDTLLGANFESVQQVLARDRRSQTGSAAETVTVTAESQHSESPPTKRPEPVADVATSNAGAIEPVDPFEAVGEVLAAAPDEAADAPVAQSLSKESPAQEPAHAPIAAETSSASESASGVVQRLSAMTQAAMAAIRALPWSGLRARLEQFLGHAFSRARQIDMRPLLPLLERINAPVQKLPPIARRAVDVVALSTVMWVPVVWAAVVFTSPQPMTPTDEASAQLRDLSAVDSSDSKTSATSRRAAGVIAAAGDGGH